MTYTFSKYLVCLLNFLEFAILLDINALRKLHEWTRKCTLTSSAVDVAVDRQAASKISKMQTLEQKPQIISYCVYTCCIEF